MTDEDPDDPIYEVKDTDDLVAREKKKMIIESRKMVNQVEAELFLAGPGDDIQVDSLTTYNHIIRQYLRNIEVLLANDDIKGATEAYKNAFLGRVTITPPVDPNQETKPDHLQDDDPTPQWAQYANSDIVLHRFSDPVEPQTFEVAGLREIIETQGRSATWDIIVDRKRSKAYDGSGPEKMTVSDFEPWNIDILNNALRTADQFLDNANIGFSLTEGEPSDGFLDL